MTSASDMATCSGVAGGLAAGQEKAAWYREVLDLEPGSKVFLPYARLLLELDRADEAVSVLRDGLGRHPEFMEARLLLIDVLHKRGEHAACLYGGIIHLSYGGKVYGRISRLYL